jgi:hypothetical protein
MSTVRELLPGDLVTSTGGTAAVFIMSGPHPMFHRLLLVIWHMGNGSLRLDALLPGDEVGDVQPIEPAARAERLADALINAAAPEAH